MRLEDLKPRTPRRGILLDDPVTVVSVQWLGSHAVELTYENPPGTWGTSCPEAGWDVELRRCTLTR
ncbi:MAG: hypothetical protein KM310_10825 [Clostridiales bacterium]|nr:hypothetical protein [Clostridiales bacterium]